MTNTNELEQACRVVGEEIMGWVRNMCGKPEWWHSNTLETREPEYLLTGNGMVELMEALREQHRAVSVGYDIDMNIGRLVPMASISSVRIIDYKYKSSSDTIQSALVLAAAKLVKDKQ